MVYSYTPTYYSSLHDSITSLCKNILPFSLKKRRLPASEHSLARLQSDNLKWQQDSFHQILNLMGLHREGILAEAEVLAFRTHLLETLIASPLEHEHPVVLRDKLVFLQELLYAKCISEDEYHCSKRPLIQRLAVQGAEIEARDVIASVQMDMKENTEEHWSEIDLRDDRCSKENPRCKRRSKPGSAIKHIKGAASALGFATPLKKIRSKDERSIFELETQFAASRFVNDGETGEDKVWEKHHPVKGVESETKSILMQGSPPAGSAKGNGGTDTAKRKPFRNLFHKDQKEGENRSVETEERERVPKSGKKQWGFDGFKKWKRNDSYDETTPLPLDTEKSDSEAYLGSCHLVSSPLGEGPNTKQIKKKLHMNGDPSDFFIDKVLGDKIKKELSRIQSELSSANSNLRFSDEQIEAISTKLPVDKADLNKFFPKSWCDRYGDVVLDVVKKEFTDHVGDMETIRSAAKEKRRSNSRRWTTFEDDDSNYENHHPNLFSRNDYATLSKQNIADTNPFTHDNAEGSRDKLRVSSSFQNPFWNT